MSRPRLDRALAALTLVWSVGRAPQESSIPAAPPDFRLDGRLDEWTRPATFPLLPRSAGSPEGAVWLAAAPNGLVVAGRVRGVEPRWPPAADRMAEGDHVEVWLADGDSVLLPPVGWGNQFGETLLHSPADCEPEREPGRAVSAADSTSAFTCRRFWRETERYRRTFRRLFVRQWQLAPNQAVETYATPALAGLDSLTRTKVSALAPTRDPAWRAAPLAEGGYGYELLIPWSAFPPVRALTVEHLRVMVDVFRPGPGGARSGAYATTAAARRWGAAETFNAVALPVPRSYRVSACGYPLAGYRASHSWYFGFGRAIPDTLPTYFIPGDSLVVDTILALENEARGYAYDPSGRSPIVTPTAFFARPLGGGVLCGPPLRFVARNQVSAVDSLSVAPDAETLALPDGAWLIRSGPTAMSTFFGSGQCGACPRVGLVILHRDSRGAVRRAFGLWEIVEPGSNDLDIAVAQRWDSVRVYRASTTDYEHFVWKETVYCFDPAARAYPVCAERDSVPEPSPRHLKYFEN